MSAFGSLLTLMLRKGRERNETACEASRFHISVALVHPVAGGRVRPGCRQSRPRPQSQSRPHRRAGARETGVPSASVAVVQHGKLVYARAYGSARLATDSSPAVPATPEMRYSIGSISKQFTAAAICAPGTGQTLARRSRRQVHSRPHARQRSDHPPDSLPHLRLPGLLARGLRDDAHAAARPPRSRSSTPGPKSRSTSSPARSGNTPTPTTSSPAASSKSSAASLSSTSLHSTSFVRSK